MLLRHASAVRGLNWLYSSWACLGTTAKPKPSPRAALVLPPSLFLEAVDKSPAGRTSRSAATHATANTCHSRMLRFSLLEEPRVRVSSSAPSAREDTGASSGHATEGISIHQPSPETSNPAPPPILIGV